MNAIPRRQIRWRRKIALHAEKRAEHVTDRLAESFGGVLHTGCLPGIPAIPCSCSAHAPVCDKAHREKRHRDNAKDDRKKDPSTVRSLLRRNRGNAPNRRVRSNGLPQKHSGGFSRRVKRELRLHTDRDTTGSEPCKADAFQPIRIMGLGQRCFARLPEEDYAIELDHDISSQSNRQSQRRRSERNQHVDERMGQLRSIEK